MCRARWSRKKELGSVAHSTLKVCAAGRETEIWDGERSSRRVRGLKRVCQEKGAEKSLLAPTCDLHNGGKPGVALEEAQGGARGEVEADHLSVRRTWRMRRVSRVRGRSTFRAGLEVPCSWFKPNARVCKLTSIFSNLALPEQCSHQLP